MVVAVDTGPVRFRFRGELIYWRGPSPYHFVALPAPEAAEIRAVARLVTYGWGVIPVRAIVGDTEFETSLFPRDGGYLLPVKDRVRLAERLALGEDVAVDLGIRSDRLG
jgi:hypothetical protein